MHRRPRLRREKLREIIEVLDDVPKLPRVSLDFADWVARYTLSSPGMVLRMMMSVRPCLRAAGAALRGEAFGAPPSRLTPARARVLDAAGNGLIWVKSSLAEAAGVSPGSSMGWSTPARSSPSPCPTGTPRLSICRRERAKLSPEQAEAASELLANTRTASW